jgi:hypothetical protein
VIRRPARALIGWMADAEATAALLGRAPIPTDDLEPYRLAAEAARSAVAGMPPRPFNEVVIDDSNPRLSAVLARPEVVASFPGLRWRPATVDLRRILSFQKLIHVDGLDDRLSGCETPDGLMELCIPTQQPAPPSGAFNDLDQKGFTISSFNPNLRIAGGQLSLADVAPAPGMPAVRMQAVTILVHTGTSYLQVVEYRGRSFIRDGYHRAAGLLRRGIYEVPCIYIKADAFEQVGMVPGAFTYEVLFGERPPFLSDFWSDHVASDVTQPAVRKVVRIRGEEFVVPR